jgi:hypothetical protein
MVRIMLAFLALLGFAAQAVPAQARLSVAGGAEVGSVVATPAPVRAAATMRALPATPATMGLQAVAPRWRTVSPAVQAPTVHLRIDRSHE